MGCETVLLEQQARSSSRVLLHFGGFGEFFLVLFIVRIGVYSVVQDSEGVRIPYCLADCVNVIRKSVD